MDTTSVAMKLENGTKIKILWILKVVHSTLTQCQPVHNRVANGHFWFFLVSNSLFVHKNPKDVYMELLRFSACFVPSYI